MWEMFRDCGSPAWGILLAALAGLMLALAALVVAALRLRRAWAWATMALVVSCLPFVGGVIGTLYGRSVSRRAVQSSSVSFGMRARILRQGYFEAQQCTRTGVTLGAVPLIGSAAALLLTLALGGKTEEHEK